MKLEAKEHFDPRKDMDALTLFTGTASKDQLSPVFNIVKHEKKLFVFFVSLLIFQFFICCSFVILFIIMNRHKVVGLYYMLALSLSSLKEQGQNIK